MNGNNRMRWLVAGAIVALLAGGILYQAVYLDRMPGVWPADQPPPPPNPPAAVASETPPPTRPKLNVALFDRLLYGMTEADIRAILRADPDVTRTECIVAEAFTEPRRIYWMTWEDTEAQRRLRLGFVNGKLEEKVLELIDRNAP